MSEAIAIRPAAPGDAAALAEFGERCFRETYAPFNEPSDLELHLSRTYGVDHQRRELADPAMSCLVALADSVVVGYALLRTGPALASVEGANPYEVRRFYVETTLHGQGLAPRLMLAAIEAARAAGAGALWLTAWEHNPRALGFYRKMGFADVGESSFYLGTARQTDRVMVLALRG